MKKNVSHETKKGSVHRASMPSITLNEAAHPADMFFGSTSPVAPSADAKQESVSRETAAVKKNEDAKNDELELLPVQGGYLVELRLSDVGPNLHQPRTIFDEDDLRELADSIKEVGVLQSHRGTVNAHLRRSRPRARRMPLSMTSRIICSTVAWIACMSSSWVSVAGVLHRSQV